MDKNSSKIELLNEIKSLDSREFYKSLFEYAPDPYYITDLEGNFIDGNKAAQKITGYQKKELVGKNFFQLNILPSHEIPKAQQTLTKNQQGISTGPDEFTLNRKDNKKIAVEIFTYPLIMRDKPLVLAIARDISKRKRTENALSERNKELNGHYRVSKIMENPNTSFDQALQTIVEFLPSAWQYPEVACARIKLYNQHFKTKNFRDTKWKQSAPITVKNKPVGELEVCYLKDMTQSKEGPFLKEESYFINALAKRISRFFKRKQAEERIKHLNQVIMAIRNVNQLIISERDRDTLIQKACNLLVETQGYHNAWIVLLDEEQNYLTSAEAGYGPVFDSMRIQLKNGNWPRCVKKVLQRKNILVTDDPKNACYNCPLSTYLQNRSAYTISLRQNNTVYGVFSACIPEPYAEDKEEQELFKEAAEDIAFALYSIKTEKNRRQAEESLRESEERFRVALKNSPIIVWSQDKDLRYNWIYNHNPEFNPEEVIGKKDEEMLPADDARVLTEIKEKVLSTGKGSTEEIRTTIKGKPFFYQLVTEPLRNTQGNIIGITCASIDITEFRKNQQKLQKNLDATIEAMSKVVEIRDPYTSGHQERVSKLATEIAWKLNLPRENIEGIRIASLIHDIGKIGVPSEILNKPTKLTDIEFSLIKAHPQTGHDIVKNIYFPYSVAEIVLQHHEKLDGSGYPNHLKEPEIKLEAKILCVADVVEAMSSHRPYRASLGIEAALDEITKNKGILYDPKIVDVCVKLFKEKGFKFE